MLSTSSFASLWYPLLTLALRFDMVGENLSAATCVYFSVRVKVAQVRGDTRGALKARITLIASVQECGAVRAFVLDELHRRLEAGVANLAAENLWLVLLVVQRESRLVGAWRPAYGAHELGRLVLVFEVVREELRPLEVHAAHLAGALLRPAHHAPLLVAELEVPQQAEGVRVGEAAVLALLVLRYAGMDVVEVKRQL